jgi:DNA polymerase III epsilon subunit-like protein
MFNKDILIVDIEASGLDAERYELIQLAAIQLDKKTLKPKQEFASYIRPKKWKTRSRAAMAINKIKKEDLANAPELETVIKKFAKLFPPSQVIFAHYGGVIDIDFVRQAFRKIGRTYPYHPYDYHFFDIWSVCYAYASLKNKLRNKKRFTGFSMEDLMKHFNIKNDERHDALADCNIEAEIFRRIMQEFKKKI